MKSLNKLQEEGVDGERYSAREEELRHGSSYSPPGWWRSNPVPPPSMFLLTDRCTDVVEGTSFAINDVLLA